MLLISIRAAQPAISKEEKRFMVILLSMEMGCLLIRSGADFLKPTPLFAFHFIRRRKEKKVGSFLDEKYFG
jgi:hypothetical protein